ncbi:MAG: CHAT domain-containing protein [Ardenticatenaceae bacterium]
MSNNEDFHITIDGSRGAYTVEGRGVGEIQVSPVRFVYDETEGVRRHLNKIKCGDAPSRQAMQGIGELLYDALFPRSIYRAWARSQAELPKGGKLRLKLNVRPPELSHLPWELLYDSDEGYFLAARLSYPIVRYIESGIPVASTLARHPLRVLYLQANPLDAPMLDLAASQEALQEALGADCEIKVVRETTPDGLTRVLREKPGFHILHYDGHATFDSATGEGHLALLCAKHFTHWLSGETLATFLDGTSVRLVVLAACNTGIDSARKRFAGIAQHLMHTSNLPAAVAMPGTL